ncbi:MAG TPA: hypothetical protein VFE52_08535 [Devosia sp.]|nr:hypothetical protein [Devosia sp.]
MKPSLDTLLAAAEARLRAVAPEEATRVMVASRTVAKIEIPANYVLTDEDKAQIETIPEVMDALAGRPVTKWLISPTYINLIPGAASPAAGGESPKS